MKADELLKDIKDYKGTDARNRMGCSEGWYDFTFAMMKTFTEDEIKNMTDHEIELLEKLHSEVAEGLY